MLVLRPSTLPPISSTSRLDVSLVIGLCSGRFDGGGSMPRRAVSEDHGIASLCLGTAFRELNPSSRRSVRHRELTRRVSSRFSKQNSIFILLLAVWAPKSTASILDSSVAMGAVEEAIDLLAECAKTFPFLDEGR